MKTAVAAFAFLFAASAVLAADPPPQALATVVAEGIGTTADEAVKDAFRNAIRQCVGALVDAETLVKNDKIITDKIITYSNGFVKSYKELSKTSEKGVFRVRISAQIERRGLIKRLTDANVKIERIDGAGLFAEVVTQVEAAKNAKKTLEVAVKAFTTQFVTGTVIGKPNVVEKNETHVVIELDVQIAIDQKRYKDGLTDLSGTLAKIALRKGTFSLAFKHSIPKFQPDDAKYFHYVLSPPAHAASMLAFQQVALMMPDVFPKGAIELKDQVVVAVCDKCNRDYTVLNYTYYVLDRECLEVLEAMSLGETQGGVRLENIAKTMVGTGPLPFLVSDIKIRGPGHFSNVPDTEGSAFTPLDFRPSPKETAVLKMPDLPGAFLSPVFLQRGGGMIAHVPNFTLKVRHKLSLEELKEIDRVSVTIKPR